MSKLLNLSKIIRNTGSLIRKCHVSFQKNSALRVTLKPGDLLHNYKVTNVVPVKEFDLTAIQLVHKTGAEHLHIAKNDSDNVFAVSLRTTPLDSTGVPHILEHVTLCGSEKFPVRDPFFKMINRSLSTFMNAFTANDWTMYPFSSQNSKDFENLLNVYLDAVFNPRLRRTDFNQEGWRLEHEKVEDSNSPIILKGVVYNEMKGVYSDAHQVYGQEAQSLLLPTGTYGVVSGGDPKFIPDLTWRQLKAFHDDHYHPSNSRFFTYGDLPLEHHLKLIDSLALSKFEAKPVSTSVPPEPKWTAPKEAYVSCPIDQLNPDPDSDSVVSVNHLLCDVTDLQESFDLSVLCGLLVDGEKAPFYQSLVESGLGSDYSPGTGFSNQTRDQIFSVGLQRVHKSNTKEVVKLINETIDKVIDEGFGEQRIEAAMHKIELSLKHQSEKFGLRMILALIPSWNHGANPVNLLQVSKHVDELNSRLAQNPQYFQQLTKKYFKDNQHNLILISEPDAQYLEKNKNLESERLEKIVSNLTDVQKKEIFEEGLELSKIQSTPDDTSCLPTLLISNVPNTHKKATTGQTILKASNDINTTNEFSVPVQTSIQPTNGMIYTRFLSDVSDLPSHLRPYLPLFCHIVTKMGAGELDYVQQSEKADLRTGGIEASNLLVDHPSIGGAYQNSVCFSSFCLERNLGEMLELWKDIFLSLSLNDHRFYTLLTSFATESASSLTSSGHRYAMMRSASTLSPFFALKEDYNGVSQLNFIKNLVRDVTSSLKNDSSLLFEPEKVGQILNKMKEIADHVLQKSSMKVSINAGHDVMDDALYHLSEFHREIKSCAHGEPFAGDSQTSTLGSMSFVNHDHSDPTFGNSHLEFPFQVNYIGKAFPTVPFSHPDFAPLKILGKILTSKYLHREIREKGGAYGGGTEAGSNAFYFYSYRDPNFLKTLESFKDSVNWAVDGKFTDQDIDEAKLSVFSQVDQPISPGNQGMRLFLSGVTEEQFANYRQSLLLVTRSEIIQSVSKHLSGAKASTAVIGPKNEDSSSSSGWSVLSDN